MFVHGPDNFPVPSEGVSDYELIVRFGGDKKNYYEYRTPVYQGWANENMVDIDFTKCTELKLADEYGIDSKELIKALTDSLTTAFTDSLAHSMSDSLAQALAESLVNSMTDSLAQVVAESLADALIMTVGSKIYTLEGNPALNNIKIISFH